MGFSLGKIAGIAGGVFAPITMAGAALNGGLDFYSAQQQNRSAEAMSNKQMEFSAAQARQQMDYQERMSNTSHQREVADLKSAGLNPLLSLNSGSSTPPGAMGTGSSAPVVPELSHFMSGARESLAFLADMKAKRADISLKEAHKANVDADTRLKKGSIPMAESKSDFVSWLRNLMKARRAEFGSAMESMRQFKSKQNYEGWRMLDLNDMNNFMPDYSE